jgi:hypothetical protein
VSKLRRERQARREAAAIPLSVRVQHKSMAVLSAIQTKLPHPVFGIVIAFLIAFTGRGALTLRSWGLLLIVAWLAVELWVWLLPQQDKYNIKYAFGWTATSAMLIGMMGIMWWWMDGILKDQQEDVQLKLSATVALPAANGPYFSKFTVRNGGSTGIGKRTISCDPVLLVASSGNLAIPRGFAEVFPTTSAEMDPGNAETDTCLALMATRLPDCIDTLLNIRYSLVTQPKIVQEKTWRFVAIPSAGIYQWDEQPVGEPNSYCDKYLSPQERNLMLRAKPPS